jgi:hypothetical protein
LRQKLRDAPGFDKAGSGDTAMGDETMITDVAFFAPA